MRSFWRSTRALLAVLAGATLATFTPQAAQAQTEPTYTISGATVDAAGKGIPNVTVRIDGTTKSVLTNANGEYTLDGLAAGTFKVLARKEGLNFDPASRTITLPTSGEPYSPNGKARFVGTPVTSLYIAGRIVNGDGGPLAGVSVKLKVSSTDPAPKTALTNTDGIYRFDNVPKGGYAIQPILSGWRFEPEQATLTLPTTGFEYSPNGRANFKGVRLTGTLKVQGLTLNGAGQPLAGVQIYRGKTIADGAVPVATSNSEGHWVVEGLAAGTYYFVPKLSGYTFEPGIGSATVPTSGLPWSPNGRIVFTGRKAETKYAIRGKVTTSAGAAIAGVTIKFNDLTTTATTSSTGEYAMENLPSGTYNVKASKDGFTFQPLSVSVTLPTSGQTYSPNGRADFIGTEQISRFTIRGKVTTTGGAALAGVTVQAGAEGPTATTSTTGEYAIEGLAAGTYIVKPSKTNFAFTPASKSVTLPTSGEAASPNGRADFVGAEQTVTKYAIRGKVTNPGGTAISGVVIKIGDAAAATTSTTGEYAIEGLVAGTYTVSASKTNFVFTPASKSVTLPTSGQTYSPNGRVEFVGAEQTVTKYAIRGKVVTTAGIGISGVVIKIGDTASATTSSTGEYAIEGLAAGTYTVSASKTNFAFTPASKSVTLPTSGLTYSPDGRVEFVGAEKTATTYSIGGRVTVSTTNVALPGVEVSLNDATTVSAVTNSEGRFTISNLPAGTYVVHVKLSGYTFAPTTRTITLPTTGLTVSPNGNAEFQASATSTP